MTAVEAARKKGCHRQTILRAIWNGELNAVRFGPMWDVKDDRKFKAWTPISDPSERVMKRWERERSAKGSRRERPAGQRRNGGRNKQTP